MPGNTNILDLTMKRKADQVDDLDSADQAKRRAPSHVDRFREGLFDAPVLDEYRKNYLASEPYAINQKKSALFFELLLKAC